MAKAKLRTQVTGLCVADFIAAQASDQRRSEAAAIDAMFRRVTACEPKMWGPSIIGYGSYTYRYESGREGTMCRAGFSPRTAAHTFYTMAGPAETDEGAALFAALGKHSTGNGCLYIKKLDDVDLAVLERLLAISWEVMNSRYPE